jgi:hypothetical protein
MLHTERYDDVLQTINAAMRGYAATTWSALPGIIQSVNFAQMTCVVQPSIRAQVRTKEGTMTFVNLPVLVDVPIIYPGGGGFIMTFPIAAGDDCLVIFADRCIDSWWQSGGIQNPAELRLHDLSDGFALVGPRSLPRVPSNISPNSVQVRSQDGQTYMNLANGRIDLVADEVNIHGRNQTSFDAGGTGFVYTPGLISTYTNGVPGSANPPHPPQVPV